jgi:hypothetical protein
VIQFAIMIIARVATLSLAVLDTVNAFPRSRTTKLSQSIPPSGRPYAPNGTN